MTRFFYGYVLVVYLVLLLSFTQARNGMPGKLTLFNVTSSPTCDSVHISWEPSTEGNDDIVKYHIQIKIPHRLIINGELYSSGVSFTTSLTGINVTNLTQKEIVYKFSISAINSKGIESEESIINITVVPKDNIIDYLSRSIINKETRISLVIGGMTFVLGAPVLAYLLGFTSTGIAVGSIGAWLMSITGPVAAGSLVAILQSIGAAGFSLAAQSLLFVAGATTGGSSIIGLTYIFSDDCVVEAVPVNF
jgi:hypothetical protein